MVKGYLSGELTKDILKSAAGGENKSIICWGRFSASESPVGNNTENFTIKVNNTDTKSTITAISLETGRIFNTAYNGSQWTNWVANLEVDATVRTGLTRNECANLLQYNGKHIFWGKFTADESPNGKTWTYSIEVEMAKDGGAKYYEIKVNHPDSHLYWITRAHGTGTSFTWTDWEEVAYKKEVVKEITASSTDEQLATAKAVFDALPNFQQVSVETTSAIAISSKINVAFKLSDNIYLFNASYIFGTGVSIPANSERKIITNLKIDGKTPKMYQPITGVLATNSKALGCVVYPASATNCELYINCPDAIVAGNYITMIGIIIIGL